MIKARKQSSGSQFSQMMASVGHPNPIKGVAGDTTQYSEDLGSSYKSGLVGGEVTASGQHFKGGASSLSMMSVP